MNVDELPEDSDTSDEDYIPGAKPEEVVSEVDSDGDPEELLSDSEGTPKKKRTRTKQKSKSKKFKRESPITVSETEENKAANGPTEEEKKKQADALWADFLQDTDFKSKTSVLKNNPTTTAKKEITRKTEEKVIQPSFKKAEPEKVKITEIFEFAGEEVKVVKEVPKDSVEARLLGTSSSSMNKEKKGGNLSGIGSVLSQLGKKKKISTLEKTKLDWDRFKKDENLEEELNNHNKGKDGYLDRQDFLQRADLRRFEIEKEIRTVERNKRMNLGDPF